MPNPTKSNRTRQSTSNRSKEYKAKERALLDKWISERSFKPTASQEQKVEEPVKKDTRISDEHKKAIYDAYLAELAAAPKKKHEEDEFED